MVLVSDGVHDNLDPEHLGLQPSECGLESWTADPQVQNIHTYTHTHIHTYTYTHTHIHISSLLFLLEEILLIFFSLSPLFALFLLKEVHREKVEYGERLLLKLIEGEEKDNYIAPERVTAAVIGFYFFLYFFPFFFS